MLKKAFSVSSIVALNALHSSAPISSSVFVGGRSQDSGQLRSSAEVAFISDGQLVDGVKDISYGVTVSTTVGVWRHITLLVNSFIWLSYLFPFLFESAFLAAFRLFTTFFSFFALLFVCLKILFLFFYRYICISCWMQ